MKGTIRPLACAVCGEKRRGGTLYAPENNTQIFTSKYKTYLPTEDELKRELRLDSFHKLDE